MTKNQFLRQSVSFDASVSGSTWYEFPVGWTSNSASGRQRQIRLTAALEGSGGFRWMLGCGGENISGFFNGIPRTEGGDLTVYINETTGGQTVDGVTTTTYGAVPVALDGSSAYQVPNRLALNSSALKKQSCLEQVNISLLATPYRVDVDADALSGTGGLSFQSFIFSQSSDPTQVVSVDETCGPTRITVTIDQKVQLLVRDTVQRTQGWSGLISLLLGLLGGTVQVIRLGSKVFPWCRVWWRRRYGGKSESDKSGDLSLVLVSPAHDGGLREEGQELAGVDTGKESVAELTWRVKALETVIQKLERSQVGSPQYT